MTVSGCRRFGLAYVALGIVSVSLAAAVAELLSVAGRWLGWLRTSSSPVDALGGWFITVTPAWLKKWAIAKFDTEDKQALLVGMALTVTVAAVLLGLLARTRVTAAVLVWCGLAAGPLTAVLTRADSRLIDVVPTIAGALLGLAVLAGAGRLPTDSPLHARTGPTGISTRVTAGSARVQVHRRRQFLRLMTFGAFVAAAAGTLSRLIPSASEVEASRARIAIPIPQDSQPIDSSRASVAPPRPATPSSRNPTPAPAGTAPTTTTPISAESTAGEFSTPTTASSSAGTSSAASGSTKSVEFPSIEGLSRYITPTERFYRIDTALSPPLIRAEDWSLRIHGMVGQEVELNYLELMAEPQVQRSITLTCVSNVVGGHLVGNATWIGVRLDSLLQRAGVLLGADCLLATSIDGFTTTTPLAALTDGRDALLAVAMNGAPLPIQHGFSVRMVVPGLYGYVSATKWLVDLEVTTFQQHSSYWTRRGYAERGPIKISSRIDVPAPYTPFSAGDSVAIAGMAWAQHKGISAVEVQIDDGAWQQADTAGQLSIDTWRQWRYRWTATRGSHIVRCRAVDMAGVVQDATVRDVLPDGATGYASLVLMVS